jgi:hypothetical protein
MIFVIASSPNVNRLTIGIVAPARCALVGPNMRTRLARLRRQRGNDNAQFLEARPVPRITPMLQCSILMLVDTTIYPPLEPDISLGDRKMEYYDEEVHDRGFCRS